MFLSAISTHLRALDFSEGMIDQAWQETWADNIEFGVGNLPRPWPAKTERHDLTICNLVLEHVEDFSHVFCEAFRSMRKGGLFDIFELHPFRQYERCKARFVGTEVNVYVHRMSNFLHAAVSHNLSMDSFDEDRHHEYDGKPPRLAVFQFK